MVWQLAGGTGGMEEIGQGEGEAGGGEWAERGVAGPAGPPSLEAPGGPGWPGCRKRLGAGKGAQRGWRDSKVAPRP